MTEPCMHNFFCYYIPEGLLVEGDAIEENILGIEDAADPCLNGGRYIENVVEFSQVKSFEDFNVVVNNLDIDSKISEDTRLKYYELCRSRNAYLHELEEPGLNYTLIAGSIIETVKIADGIKGATLATGRDVLEEWDRILRGMGYFGMEVGFLRARISELIRLREAAETVARKEKDKATAEEIFKNVASADW
ncbi:PREDICTED: B3 domain-containing protein Os01g0234100-like [Ipomoea nil]|uniref:B3 domain-containing protein Os01g0234100-like n=1 Tax=Ipomoea nil TaxID=35883 RepID=UPI0009017F22|nr:PREDICTED: B3 domain-containing protein Os01g0234100-like [Ipomoea nil]